MTNNDFNNWFMYYELIKLKNLGFSKAKIASFTGIDPRTVSKYLQMDEQEYEQFLYHSQRPKLLDGYEDFVFNRLKKYQDTSTAQIHDWLKEHHLDFPKVSPRTVFNFVMYVRQKYNLPVELPIRDYFPVEELPYGQQAQIDFGEYNMLNSDGNRKKVRFFAMVLARSRMKFTRFIDHPFTSLDVINAHEEAFEFFRGIPKVLVYDQDRTIIVDENMGDIILTADFKQYTKSRNFKLHFCRKSDPESKGKIENVIQYIKKNFLYNRTFYDLSTLNEQAIDWLYRTANSLEHNYTKKSPQDEFSIEKNHLAPFTPLPVDTIGSKMYYVRKTNTISYKSNFYILPCGTYKGTGTQVIVKENRGFIDVYDQKKVALCSLPISSLKGQTIGVPDRKRDTSNSIKELINKAVECFTDTSQALKYFDDINKTYPRYSRDHLLVILHTLSKCDKQTADKTLAFCVKNNLFSSGEWEDVYHIFDHEAYQQEYKKTIILLDKTNLDKANQMPQTSNIDDYENIVIQ